MVWQCFNGVYNRGYKQTGLSASIIFIAVTAVTVCYSEKPNPCKVLLATLNLSNNF